MYNRVNQLCKERGLSIRRLEQQLDLGNGVVSGWKKSDPSLKTLKKLAWFFGITLDELVYGKRE